MVFGHTLFKGVLPILLESGFFFKKIRLKCFPDIFGLRQTFDTRSVPMERYCRSASSRLVFIEKYLLVMDLQTLEFVDKKSTFFSPKYQQYSKYRVSLLTLQ